MKSIVKILTRMKQNPKGIRFSELSKVCDFHSGEPRQKSSSHRIYKTPLAGRSQSQYSEFERDGQSISGNPGNQSHRQTQQEGRLEKMPADHYTYRVTWSPEDQEYVGLCLEFPSMSWLAKTPETALKGMRKLVAEVVRDLVESNEPVPEPLADRHYSGKFMVRLPSEVHRELALQAAEENISLNRLVSMKLSH